MLLAERYHVDNATVGRVKELGQLTSTLSRIISTIRKNEDGSKMIEWSDRTEIPTVDNGKNTVASIELAQEPKMPFTRVNFFSDGTCSMTPSKKQNGVIAWDRGASWRVGLNHLAAQITERICPERNIDGLAELAVRNMQVQISRFC